MINSFQVYILQEVPLVGSCFMQCFCRAGDAGIAVSPGGVWTPMLRQWCSEQRDPNTIEAYLNDIHPLGYCPNGDVIADACVFLLSEKARFITGAIMPVSGGAEMRFTK